MMRYIPHTSEDIRRMLEIIGVSSIEELFSDIPAEIRLKRPMNLPGQLSEPDLLRLMTGIAGENRVIPPESNFLGGGANRHVIPCLIDQMLLRSEFYTAYTPYQPEISQGTLQAIFEFQSLICMLTGMDVANASMYDGASATAEACLMAMRLTRRKKILVSSALNPHYRQVIETYLRHQEADIVAIPLSDQGTDDPAALKTLCDDTTAALVTQYPNFFGIVQDNHPHAEIVHQHKALLIMVVTEPVALGLLQPPGSFDADIAVGDGQSFGIAPQFGGPYVGFLATRQAFVRQMPGRLVGETTDKDGKRGFVLTLATREQHIRREKATSNICTNQGLCALAATICMTVLGKAGIRELAMLNLSKATYARNVLSSVKGVSIAWSGATFHEFVLEMTKPAAEVLLYLEQQGFAGGIDLSQWYPAMPNRLLVSVTEMNTRTEIDRLARSLTECMSA